MIFIKEKLMDKLQLFKLYEKEREYQRCCFGEYRDLHSLNLASFLLFIEKYIERAKKGYAGKWDDDLPEWLKNSVEMSEGSSPVTAYEELIKVFALTGAALETFCNIDYELWRKDPQEKIRKWKE
jgi:hypothetical protein